MPKDVMIGVDGLQIGMYVSRLDRPWIKTPFMLKGLRITTADQISTIRKYCNYVYVDVEKGKAPHLKYWTIYGKPGAQPLGQAREIDPEVLAQEREEYRALRQTDYKSTVPTTIEMHRAHEASKRVSGDYEQLIQDLNQGRTIDMKVVKVGVSAMVESIVRNPSAMLWIAQMKDTDIYTYTRALGTSVWCATFGRHLGLEKEAINQLALGGLLLDVGKSKLPPELLNKKESLSIAEIKQIRKHVVIGLRMLTEAMKKNAKGMTLDQPVIQMIATHHERADGSGYPQGMKNRHIPMFGRIAGIVDSYDAITSERPYTERASFAPHEAISELYNLRGAKFQAELVEQFIQAVGLYPTGSLVELNSGQVGVVVEVNSLRRLQPTLMLLLDENKEPYAQFNRLDLSTAENNLHVIHGLPTGAFGINMHELFL